VAGVLRGAHHAMPPIPTGFMSGGRLLGGAGFAGRGLMKVIIADDMSPLRMCPPSRDALLRADYNEVIFASCVVP
jgi:hypothetical protein